MIKLMIFDEKNRNAKLLIEAGVNKNLTPQQTFETFIDMNNAVLSICIESIRAADPGISEKDLLEEVKKAYSFRR